MKTENHYVVPVKLVLIAAIIALVTFTGVVVVSGVLRVNAAPVSFLPGDGRINVVTHFGGDAFYCVDGNRNPTNQYSDNGAGGFRLLDINGQELWFVPTTPTVFEATQQALATGEYTLVAEGQGTYGPVSLYTFLNGDGDVLFTFNGFDEWGKPNSMTFKFCEPVNPILQSAASESSSSGLCSQNRVNNIDSEEEFLHCYNLACPDIPFDSEGAQACFCSQYPDFVLCGPIDGNDG